MSALAPIIFLIIGVFLYFLPAIIAVDRKLLNTGSIFIVNMFLGRILIGWINSTRLGIGWSCGRACTTDAKSVLISLARSNR